MENPKVIWENLTEEQKENYLIFWFNYYGGTFYTLEEFEKFMELAKTRADEIYAHICTLFIMKNTIQSSTLVSVIRQNKVDELLANSISKNSIEALDIKPDDKKEMIAIYEDTRQMIINEIVKAAINPEPNDSTVIIDPGTRH